MSPELFALLQRVHGHLAVLGLAVLLHPVLRLGRPPGRGTRWSLGLAGLLIALPYGLGLALYPSYRRHLKPGLVGEHLDLARAFETKEHLAFFCVVLCLGGVALALSRGDHPGSRRLARVMLGLSWLCGLITALIGLAVASGATPAW